MALVMASSLFRALSRDVVDDRVERHRDVGGRDTLSPVE